MAESARAPRPTPADDFLAPRLVDVLALGSLATEVRPVTLEGSDLPLRRFLRSVSLEERLWERQAWSSGDLGLVAAGEPRFSYRLRLSPSQRRLQRLMDDKVEARRFFSRLRLEAPPWTTVRNPVLEHRRVVERLGLPYVLQAPCGSGGAATWIVTGDAHMAPATPSGGCFLASAWLEGTPVNVHLFIGEREAIVSAPSIQIIGAAVGLTDPAVYSGADFASFARLPQRSTEPFLSGAERLAAYLHQLGWRGLVGVDAIVRLDHASFLELNPRYQSSTWLLAEGEGEMGLTPLGELEARRDPLLPVTSGPVCVRRREPLELATLIVRAREEREVEPHRSLVSGRYRVDSDGGLRFVDDAFGVATLDDRHVLVEGTPPPGVHLIRKNGALARLTVRGSLIDREGRPSQRAALFRLAVEGPRALTLGSAGVPSSVS